MRAKKQSSYFVMVILAFIPMLMVLGNAVLIPAMPEMQTKMHVSALQISMLITLFSVPAGIVIPIAGFLSDQMPRKAIIAPSLLVFGAGGILAGCAAWLFRNPFGWVLLGRILQGIGASGTAPIAMAMVGDLFSGSARSQALGINEAGNALGKVVSPIIGSLVAALAWFAVFFIFPVLCVPVAAALWWIVPNQRTRSERQSFGRYLRSLKQVLAAEGRWLWVAYLCGAAGLFTLFGILFDLSELLEGKYHILGMRKGWILAIPLLVLCVSALGTGSFIRKRKQIMKWFIIGGVILVAGAMIGAPLTGRTASWLVALATVAALGIGCVLPCLNTFITSAVSKERRGVVTSLYGSVRFLGVAAGPPAFTWLRTVSPTWMFLSVGGLAVLCAGLVSLQFRLPRPSDSERTAFEGTKLPGRQKART